MKKLFTVFCVILFVLTSVYAQTKKDTKDFILEKIEANPPTSSYENSAFFQNILRIDAEHFAGEKLTDNVFQHLFMYGREYFSSDNESEGFWMESIDIRGINKVSITKAQEKYNYYVITLYLSNSYHKKRYVSYLNEIKHDHISKMEILIGDNKEVADKLKKAFIHLGSLYEIKIKDGDIF